MRIAALDFMPFIWIAIAVLAVVLDVRSQNKVVLNFALSAFVSLVLVFFGVRPRMQVIVFFVASAVLVVVSKGVSKKIRKMNISLDSNDDIDNNGNEDI